MRMHRRALFQDAAANRGGALDQVAHDEDMYLCAVEQQFERFFPWLHEVNVFWGFLARKEINALAFEKNSNHFVGITRTSLNTIVYTMSTLFCDPRCFLNIGDANREEQGRVLLPSSDSMRQTVRAHLEAPNDPVRENVMQMSILMANQFLFGHELGHVIRGHLFFLDLDYLWEVDAGRTSLDRRELWALELDADRYGYNLARHSVPRGAIPFLNQGVLNGHWRPDAMTRLRALHLSFAVILYILSHLSALDDIQRTHPHALFRLVFLEEEMRLLEGFDSEAFEEWRQEFIDAFHILSLDGPAGTRTWFDVTCNQTSADLIAARREMMPRVERAASAWAAANRLGRP